MYIQILKHHKQVEGWCLYYLIFKKLPPISEVHKRLKKAWKNIWKKSYKFQFLNNFPPYIFKQLFIFILLLTFLIQTRIGTNCIPKFEKIV